MKLLTMMGKILLGMSLILVSCSNYMGDIEFNEPDKVLPPESSGDALVLDIEQAQWKISPLLNGTHFVYAYEPDQLYQDERILRWMQESKVGILRWPGGTAVQYYHWDDLNGIAFQADTWMPGYDQGYEDPAGFMDVDEFVTLCRKVGAEPMIGVNIRSGKQFKREKEGEDEARRLIQHCKEKGYQVKYWYIGNEGYASGFGAKDYVAYLDRYAGILRAVDPDIKIVGDWKFGPESKNRFEELLYIASHSKEVDIMEVHEKWAEGWGLVSGKTMSDWKKQTPLYDGLLGEYTRKFYAHMDKIGKKVVLAMNEWGLGNVDGAGPFEHGLVAADYMIEMFRNKIFSACYWNLNMGPGNARLLNVQNYGTPDARLQSLSVICNVFTLFAPSLGQTLIPVTSPVKEIYGFAAHDAAAGKLYLYLLNKTDGPVRLPLECRHFKVESMEKTVYAAPGTLKTTACEDFSTVELPGMSVSRISLQQ